MPLNNDVMDRSGNNVTTSLIIGSLGDAWYLDSIAGPGLHLENIYESEPFAPRPTANQTDGAYVSIDYTMADSGTFACWYQTAPDPYQYQSIFDNSAHADKWEGWIDAGVDFSQYFWEPGRVWFRISNAWDWGANNGVFYDPPSGYVGEQWLHYAVTWERNPDMETAKIRLYINGVLVDQSDIADWEDPGDTVYLGGGNDGNTYGAGVWDEVFIFDRALSESEIAYLANPTAGDANLDMAVNVGDLSILVANWGSTTGDWLHGDFNGDVEVNVGDLSVLVANWGGAAVPEPATIGLILFGALAAIRRR